MSSLDFNVFADPVIQRSNRFGVESMEHTRTPTQIIRLLNAWQVRDGILGEPTEPSRLRFREAGENEVSGTFSHGTLIDRGTNKPNCIALHRS